MIKHCLARNTESFNHLSSPSSLEPEFKPKEHCIKTWFSPCISKRRYFIQILIIRYLSKMLFSTSAFGT